MLVKLWEQKMYILARGNRNSGKLETGIPDAGNQLNSAYAIYACINGICQAHAAQAVRSRLDKYH